jgi:ribonuclease D
MSEDQLNHEARLVASTQGLAELTQNIATASVLALDTEFLRERTFFPELCLIQVATKTVIAAVDCLAGVALDGFADALSTPQHSWVLHSSSQDLEILLQSGVTLPSKLIDTQIAGALLGMTPQIGYAQLVEDLMDIQLDKSHTRTDWRRRPITPAALEYAIDDVRYLLPLWSRLEHKLRETHRYDWFTQDCASMLESFRQGDKEWPWERIKGVRSLDQTSQAVARSLSSWRETEAARINRPRRWLLSDEVLVALARGQPASKEELAKGYTLNGKFISRHAEKLLDVIEMARSGAHQHRILASNSLSPPERQQLKLLSQTVRNRAEDLGLATEVLATRQEMTDWMRGQSPGRLATGWRAEVMADVSP